MSKHYVNNEEFYKALRKHRAAVNRAKREKKEIPRIPEYIGSCLMEIANRFATKHNFVLYHFREEMVMDAVENCITYLLNFNPKKSKNPFAYFTQIVYYAFLRRIEKEHKHSYIQHKVMEDEMLNARLAGHGEHILEMQYPSESVRHSISDFVENFEAKLNNRKNKKKGLAKNE
jgi:hypothetical protein